MKKKIIMILNSFATFGSTCINEDFAMFSSWQIFKNYKTDDKTISGSYVITLLVDETSYPQEKLSWSVYYIFTR